MMSIQRQKQETIQQLFRQIKDSYQELKNSSDPYIQNIIIQSILPRCQSALVLLEQKLDMSSAAIKSRQIKQIMATAQKIKIKNKEEVRNQDEPVDKQDEISVNSVKMYEYNPLIDRDTQMKIARRTVYQALVSKDLKSLDLKISEEELLKILEAMENNNKVVKLTNEYLHIQGDKLDNIEQTIEKIYENSKQANEELERANQEQMKILKGIQSYCRKTASGLWGLIKWPFKTIFWWGN